MTSATARAEDTLAYWNERARGTLPGVLGLEILELGLGAAHGRMPLQPLHLAPNGYLHAAAIVCVADTLCGAGCMVTLPEGATGFTTIETKSNHLGTARNGSISANARLVHGGRTTQVWDAEVIDDSTGKTIALFRCTQMVLYPRD